MKKAENTLCGWIAFQLTVAICIDLRCQHKQVQRESRTRSDPIR